MEVPFAHTYTYSQSTHTHTRTHTHTHTHIHTHTHTQAQREDELDVTPEEILEVLEWDDGDGWCKGKNKLGKEGYFPQSYVQPSSRSSSPPTVVTTQHLDSVSTLNSVSGLSSVGTLSSVTSPTTAFLNGSGRSDTL